MRKVLYSFILVFVLIFTLSSCGDEERTHEFSEWAVTQNSTCTFDGTEERTCSCGEKETKPINALGHVEVIDSAVAATCTTDGKTEGKHCSVCNETLVAQTTVDALGHVEVIDSAVAATCTTDGKTEGKHCSVCNETLVAQTTIPSSHQYSTNYEHDDEYHWLVCTSCGDIENKAIHSLDDEGVCTVCNLPVSSTPGVVYDISADGTYAEVIGYNGTATKVKIAEEYNGLPVMVIYEGAFGANEIITSVIIPNSITSIMERAFAYCSHLSSVVIGDSVTSIGERAFVECYSLTSVIIPDSVTTIGYAAFDNCTSLTSVVIGNGVTSIGDSAFCDCSSLTSVVIGDSVTSICTTAFSGCSMPFNEYENCKYLGSKDNPYFALIQVTTRNFSSYTIHEDTKIVASPAFAHCSRFTSIVIPDGVISIGYAAFDNCTSLKSIVIPDSVTSIDSNAFEYCDSLTDIYYTGSEEEWKRITIGSSNSPLRNATIHYNYIPEE